MTKIDDEILMAFADGELGDDRSAEVEAALAADPALRVRLQEIQDTDGLLRAAIAPNLDVPDGIAQLLQPTAKVVPLRTVPRAKWWIPAGASVAAACALWVAATSVMPAQTAGWLRNVDDGVMIAGPLASAAESTRSGDLARSADLSIRPVVSFVADDGRACRELHVRDKDMAARIIACRNPQAAEWRVEALANSPAQEFPDTYQPAGVVRNPVIDAALARLGMKSAMDADQENAAIAQKWTAK